MSKEIQKKSKRFQVVQYTKDNIPGFRDSSEYIIGYFDTIADAERELSKHEDKSVYTSGFGAGSGTYDTSYFIRDTHNKFNEK